MTWLAKILRVVPRDEMDGICLDTSRPHWELSGASDFPALFAALPDLLPEGSMLYFEGGSPSGELREFLRVHSVPEPVHVAYGTIWPRPRVFHIPANEQTLMQLAELTESCASPELAIHFHVYRGQTVLLEWHDAFAQPMLLAGELPEEQVRAFAVKLLMEPQKRTPTSVPSES